jgi:penicillin amidase
MPSPITKADLRAALPDVRSVARIKGLERPVEVFRDRWGVPHVRAQNEHDAFLAQGYVTAQDRLWHMDYDRRRALGRWAEAGGPSGLTSGAVGIAGDRLLRRMQVARAAQADYGASSAAARSMLDAYARGVNAFLETTRSWPVEYRLLGGVRPEPWAPWHSLAVYKVRNMLMGTFEAKLWRGRVAAMLGPDRAASLFRGYPRGHLLTIPPGDTFGGPELDGLEELTRAAEAVNWLKETDAGSNSWVISGKRSGTGLPLVAGDSHRALDTPSVYYQVHIECPEWAVSGYSVPGVPGAPHFSHTRDVAYGMTHGNADYQDLYIEQFRPAGAGLEYLYKGSWLPAEVREEKISVLGGATETLRVVVTRHGPIVAGDPFRGRGLAFSHTGTNSGTPWPNAVYDVLRASDADGLEDAMREWTEPVNNYMYGDVHGNFGYRLRGRIPVRSMANAWRPVEGWTGEHEWRGLVPFEEMPHSRNPKEGYAVTCNQRVVAEDFPHYIGLDFSPDYRARRITARILELGEGRAMVEDMSAIHAERVSIPATVLRDALRRVEPSNAGQRAALRKVAEWDGSMDRGKVAPLIYAAVRVQLSREVIGRLLGPLAPEALGATGRGAAGHVQQLAARIVESIASDDTRMLAPGESWRDVLARALARGLEDLEAKLGGDQGTWRYGALHRTLPRHPLSAAFPAAAPLLDPPGTACHGDGDTPLQGGYNLENPFIITGLSVNRYIHDPADWSRSRWIVPMGVSGHPGSPHYSDQMRLWADIRTIPQLWDWRQIANEAETRQELVPA